MSAPSHLHPAPTQWYPSTVREISERLLPSTTTDRSSTTSRDRTQKHAPKRLLSRRLRSITARQQAWLALPRPIHQSTCITSPITSSQKQLPYLTANTNPVFAWLPLLPLIAPFLSACDGLAMQAIWPNYRKGFSAALFLPPNNPHRRCTRSCGPDHYNSTTQHTVPSGFLMLHFAWDFMTTSDRIRLARDVSPIFAAYAHLRWDSLTQPTNHLLIARTAPSGDHSISHSPHTRHGHSSPEVRLSVR